jgi:hypothetical protein
MAMRFRIGKAVVFQWGEESKSSREGKRVVGVKRSRDAHDTRLILERLEDGVRILEAIDQRRLIEGHAYLGWAIEQAVINRELQELEEDLHVRSSRA